MKVAVTGHRPDKLWGYDMSDSRYIKLSRIIAELFVECCVTDVYDGMALGVDTLVADTILRLNQSNSMGWHINLHACIPCWRQEVKWPESAQRHYYEVISKVDTLKIVTKMWYRPELMQRRNEYMVDNSDSVISVWDGTWGGTANCVLYARNSGKEVININPREIVK